MLRNKAVFCLEVFTNVYKCDIIVMTSSAAMNI